MQHTQFHCFIGTYELVSYFSKYIEGASALLLFLLIQTPELETAQSYWQ